MSTVFQFPILILVAFTGLCGFFVLDITQYAVSWKLTVQLFDLVSGEPPLPPKAEQDVRQRHRQKLDKVFLAKMIVLLLVYLVIAVEVLRRFALLTSG